MNRLVSLLLLDAQDIVGGVLSATLNLRRLSCPVALLQVVEAEAAAGRVACVFHAVRSDDRKAADTKLRAELNDAALRFGCFLIPCVFTGSQSARIGPFVRGRSTACLRCFESAGPLGRL